MLTFYSNNKNNLVWAEYNPKTMNVVIDYWKETKCVKVINNVIYIKKQSFCYLTELLIRTNIEFKYQINK